jgi:murein DD-endopeptidase MepM/ murein hydrolase activator NlpD
VIIKHTLSNCSTIYSTYSHLGSIDSKMVVGASVTRGQKVGTIGGSGYGKSSYWGTHLHFEMKSSPVTYSPWGGTYWGYTPKWPDSYGYSNPSNYIGR